MSKHAHDEYEELLAAARAGEPGQLVGPPHLLADELSTHADEDGTLVATVVDANAVRVNSVVLRDDETWKIFVYERQVQAASLDRIEFEMQSLGWSRIDRHDSVLTMNIADFVPDLGLLVDPVDKALELLRRQKRSPDTYIRAGLIAGLFVAFFITAAAIANGVSFCLIASGFVLSTAFLFLLIPAVTGALEGLVPWLTMRSYPARVRFELSDDTLVTQVEVSHGRDLFHGYQFAEFLPREVDQLVESAK